MSTEPPKSFKELDPRQRRREVLETTLALLLIWVLVIGIYYVVPFTDLSKGESVFRLALGITVFVVVFVGQLRRVMRAELPGLRAVQALGGAIPLFLVVFASVYLSISLNSPPDFSEPLEHTGALYFVVTIFSTVGFGDITPKSDFARIIVSFQMLLDLVIIGVVVKLLVAAARSGRDA
jgi:voltage-gated potassium channel